jgi:hypothetical protein
MRGGVDDVQIHTGDADGATWHGATSRTRGDSSVNPNTTAPGMPAAHMGRA